MGAHKGHLSLKVVFPILENLSSLQVSHKITFNYSCDSNCSTGTSPNPSPQPRCKSSKRKSSNKGTDKSPALGVLCAHNAMSVQ